MKTYPAKGRFVASYKKFAAIGVTRSEAARRLAQMVWGNLQGGAT